MSNIQISVSQEAINLEKTLKFQPSPEHGAANHFLGFVRNLNLGKQVKAVEYDCYKALCEKVLAQIAHEAKNIWDDSANILVVHRHGKLQVGEPSVVIVATTRHRDESYKISRYIIEEIKVRAPIWKKEFYLDGETEWVRGHALCQHAPNTNHRANNNINDESKCHHGHHHSK